MKAEELMIGDWVRVTDDDTDAFFDARVGTLTRVENIFVVPPGEEMAQPFSIDCVEPIPLTPEILEKNGMKEFEHRNPWQGENLIKKWYHKSGDYYVSLYQVGREQSYTFGDGSRPTRICNIHYVHELQHALNLCRIEKEIVL